MACALWSLTFIVLPLYFKHTTVSIEYYRGIVYRDASIVQSIVTALIIITCITVIKSEFEPTSSREQRHSDWLVRLSRSALSGMEQLETPPGRSESLPTPLRALAGLAPSRAGLAPSRVWCRLPAVPLLAAGETRSSSVIQLR